MLAFLVLAQEWQVQQDQVTESLSEVLPRVENDPGAWVKALEEFEAPEDILTLRRQKNDADRRAETLREALDEAELRRDEAEKEIERSREETRQAVQARDEAQKQVEEAERELLVLREKGHNPPCWYEKVPNGAGGEREKPYYTFDVAVLDDNMVVRRLEPPPGRAEDDDGAAYAEEARQLQLDRIPYDSPLDDTDVIRHLQPIHEAGKRAEVRSYSCIFWVRVWDETSPDAKMRWQQAHDRILEGLFGTFRVTNDPWSEP